MNRGSLPYPYILEAVGLSIEIISNNFNEFAGNTHQKIIFPINEEEPDTLAFSVLFSLSLMSFTFSGPGGYSEKFFVPDEELGSGVFIARNAI